jgi:phenylpyruvate tautomerase PptA (4-oxalocrotonate tautomerase family)
VGGDCVSFREFNAHKTAIKVVIGLLGFSLSVLSLFKPPEITQMPFIRTALPRSMPQARRKSIVDGVHEALIHAIGMPADELFNLVSPYDPDEFFFDKRFNGIARSDSVIVIEITMRRGRSDAMKRALYARIADNLSSKASISPKDIFIFMHENDYSDWSVGNGVFAMNIVQNPGIDGPSA